MTRQLPSTSTIHEHVHEHSHDHDHTHDHDQATEERPKQTVTIEDLGQAALDASRPLGDRDRSEVATIVARVSPAKAKILIKRLRALFDLARQFDGSGDESLRLTLAGIPVVLQEPAA